MVELIVTAINVFILFFLMGYLVSDMAAKMLNGRRDRIAGEINTAKLSREEALALKNDYEQKLASFDSERAQILEKTRQRAALAQENILLEGRKEAGRLIDRANREAALMKLKLADEVRNDMIMAASQAAGRMVAAGISEEQQSRYVQEMLDEMGESTWQN